MKIKKENIENIENLSYTDFVAFVNQTNVPPGSFSTVTKWMNNSNLSKDSNVLEIACTTGFSILNLVKNSGCSGVGIDISESSINRAKENSISMGLNSKTQFINMDATKYTSDRKYTHIVVGAGLGFFPKPDLMIKQMEFLFDEEGYLLASPFYVTSEIPKNLVESAKNIFGITPTNIGYKDVMALYNNFNIHYEDRIIPEMETESELTHYCESTIIRACKIYNITDEEYYSVMYNRLYKIKEMSNKLRPYQGYSVIVFSYDKKIYPNRYVELF
ncbi:class I SAM-dependent methyltransferase [Photorhabdus viridis]|uniref:class I SAM-dependent methyltransferase n=1 Tax=Photorhabdus viridis TaxID=3163327 RepID=UPI003306CF1B